MPVLPEGGRRKWVRTETLEWWIYAGEFAEKASILENENFKGSQGLFYFIEHNRRIYKEQD